MQHIFLKRLAQELKVFSDQIQKPDVIPGIRQVIYLIRKTLRYGLEGLLSDLMDGQGIPNSCL